MTDQTAANALTQSSATGRVLGHGGSDGDPLCAFCSFPFKPARRCEGRQKFGSEACRNAYHAARAGHGMRARISSVRLLKRGETSITLRVPSVERERAVQFEPGREVELEVA